jgi:hypothetical protein
MISLQNARRFEDLLGTDVEPSPYEFSLLFKTDGWLDRRRSKTRFKLLQAINSKLCKLLHEGERVYFATSGTTTNAAEHYFTGAAMAQALNRRALIFTTERVILLQIDSRKRPGALASQIAYTSIAEVKSTWSGYCQLKLRNKSKLNFIGVPKADRKNLAAMLTDVVGSVATQIESKGAPALEHLCPHCFVPVPGHPETCPHCQGHFKSARTAMLRSLLFPGLGDLYLGHRSFALIEMLGAAFFWYVMVFAPLIGAPDENGEITETTTVYWGIAVVMLAGVHGIDAVMTRHFALKGHHPV